MPAEIADSDGESELDSPAQSEQPLPKHHPQTQQSVLAYDSEVHFSDFRNQEQQPHQNGRLRSPDLQQTADHAEFESGKVTTGVADKSAQKAHPLEHDLIPSRFASIPPGPASMEVMGTSSRKRRYTMLGESEVPGQTDHSPQKLQRKKRARTYGNNTSHMSSSSTPASNGVSDHLTSNNQRAGEPPNFPGLVSSASDMVDSATSLSSAMPIQSPATSNSFAIEDESDYVRQRKPPPRVLSLIDKSTCETAREISTSRSSMGNYESINIDFRAGTGGLDAGANPFGDLSQPSAGDAVEEAEQEVVETESGSNRETTNGSIRTGAMDPPRIDEDSDRWKGYRALDGPESRQTPGESRSIDPVSLHNRPPSDAPLLSSSKSLVKKSQRSNATLSTSPALDTDLNPIDGSISDASNILAKLNAGRRGRKAKNQRNPSISPEPTNEDEPKLNPYELTIELPMEQYKPRPSRSRGATNEVISRPASLGPAAEDQTRSMDQQSSPVKHPTSELNLIDEAFIGLPKEHYKPRPSRSRSKKIVVDEDEDPTLPASPPAADQPPISSVNAPSEASSTPAKKSTKPRKPAKKTKVKRAKTSAGALLKKSEPMLSEGEEDVLWLETKPSQVKLDPPREIKLENVPTGEQAKSGVLKAVGVRVDTDGEEQVEERHNPHADEASQGMHAAKSHSTNVGTSYGSGTNMGTGHILIDIPPLSSTLPRAEPKKRGRKKKASTAAIDEGADFEEPSRGSDASDLDANGVPEDEDVSAPSAKPEPKKRGRKKKVVDVPAELEKAEEKLEQRPDVSNSLEKMTKSSRPVLVEKDINVSVPPTNSKTSNDNPQNLANETSSPEKKDQVHSAVSHQETPHKLTSMDVDSAKGPTKHSPINPSGGKTLYRVGLSKRAAIPSLLKIVRKDIARPKEKEKPKRKAETHLPVENED